MQQIEEAMQVVPGIDLQSVIIRYVCNVGSSTVLIYRGVTL